MYESSAPAKDLLWSLENTASFYKARCQRMLFIFVPLYDSCLDRHTHFWCLFQVCMRTTCSLLLSAGRVCALLTISAVWFLVRTALWRAVMPSLVLKSRWAPPFFRTFMSSAQPSSCDAIVNGHSEHRETTVDFFLFLRCFLSLMFSEMFPQNK